MATGLVASLSRPGGNITGVVVKRAAREGRNPSTGAPLKIKAAKRPRFSAGKGLKEAVNK